MDATNLDASIKIDMTVDALGDACPLPVVKAKQALDTMGAGTLQVLVDNDIAVTNLTNFAKKKNCEIASEQLEEKKFSVLITAPEPSGEDCGCVEMVPAKKPVVVISSETMGTGDDELGAILMKGFVFALTQLDELPEAVLFYNGGVKIACEGSQSLDDLRALEAAGVSILACGTCLNYYNLADKLAVGEPTNMYVIVDTQANAGAIIRP